MSPRRSAAHRVQTRIHEQNSEPVKPDTLPIHGLNTKGLPTVPAELLLEILSYMQTMPIPCNSEPIRAEYKERSMALCALFQTCRSLRSALRPFVWERIEVCTANGDTFSNRWCKDVATDLIEQLEIVTIREPSFASHVKTVTVVISNHCLHKVLREFSRCLALMPNLQTIQIIDMRYYCSARRYYPAVHEATFDEGFQSSTFPSIQHVIMSPQAHVLFHCFPNARRVYLNWSSRRYSCNNSISGDDHDACRKWLSEVAKHCPNVEEFGSPDVLGRNIIESVISTLPRLRSLQFHGGHISVGFIRPLHELRNLEKVEFVVPPWKRKLQAKREEAIRVLEKSHGDSGKKRLVIITRAQTGDEIEVAKFAP
ncbi:hypothetical protein APHAL10511_004979 [Amanita phalloides]|nr:hypothetical protein APHAL10511_004979 [Amanita phalloides]